MNNIPNGKQFAVLGVGRFGSAVAKQLYSWGKEVPFLLIYCEGEGSESRFYGMEMRS